MKTFTTKLSAALLVLALPTLTFAQPPDPSSGGKSTGRILTGLALIGGGIGFIYGSTDFQSSCGPGDTEVTISGMPRQCVTVAPRYVSVDEGLHTSTVARPWMMWTGLGLGVAGFLTLALPAKAQKVAPAVSFTK